MISVYLKGRKGIKLWVENTNRKYVCLCWSVCVCACVCLFIVQFSTAQSFRSPEGLGTYPPQIRGDYCTQLIVVPLPTTNIYQPLNPLPENIFELTGYLPSLSSRQLPVKQGRSQFQGCQINQSKLQQGKCSIISLNPCKESIQKDKNFKVVLPPLMNIYNYLFLSYYGFITNKEIIKDSHR